MLYSVALKTEGEVNITTLDPQVDATLGFIDGAALVVIHDEKRQPELKSLFQSALSLERVEREDIALFAVTGLHRPGEIILAVKRALEGNGDEVKFVIPQLQ